MQSLHVVAHLLGVPIIIRTYVLEKGNLFLVCFYTFYICLLNELSLTSRFHSDKFLNSLVVSTFWYVKITNLSVSIFNFQAEWLKIFKQTKNLKYFTSCLRLGKVLNRFWGVGVGLGHDLLVLKREKIKHMTHLFSITCVMPSVSNSNTGCFQVCLVGWLGSDSGIYNW